MLTLVNIGMGINVNNDPPADVAHAVALKQILGRKISRKELLATFLDEFEQRLKDLATDNIISEWKKYTVTLKRRFKVVTAHDVSEGLAVDVDDSGALILELADASTKRVVYGDCFNANTSADCR